MINASISKHSQKKLYELKTERDGFPFLTHMKKTLSSSPIQISTERISTKSNTKTLSTITSYVNKKKNKFILSPLSVHKHQIANPSELSKRTRNKIHFGIPGSNTNISKSSELITSITKLNKQLIQSSIFKGKNEICYSKKDYDTVKDYLTNKEIENEMKGEELCKNFYERKQSRLGDNAVLSPVKRTSSKKGLSQEEFASFKEKHNKCLTQRTKRKSQLFAKQMFNLIQVHPEEDDEERKEVNQRDFEDDDEDNSLLKKLKKEKSSNVNYAVLKKQIRIYNLIQNGSNRMRMIDEINLKEDLGEDFTYGVNSLKYNLKPNFLKTKFKKITLRKVDGIDGKFFGIPV